MEVLQVTARSVEKAIEQGLKELGKTQEEVDIKILEQGGLFKKAKIELYYECEEKPKETKKEEKKIEKEANKEAKQKEKNKKKQETPAEEKQQQEEKTLQEVEVEFLKGLFEKMSVTAEIDVLDTDDSITFNATGKDVSRLIGKRGETLNAIQDLMSQIARKNKFKGKKVFFDVENYKNRREMALIQLAEKMANKAKSYGKPVKLERLNAYERRIVHTAIAEIEGVSTHSEGEEPHRNLIIIPDNMD